MKLTKQERLLVAKEVAERCKDAVFMNADQHSREIVGLIRDDEISTELQKNEVVLHYHCQMCIGDILQIVGRYRRRKKRK